MNQQGADNTCKLIWQPIEWLPQRCASTIRPSHNHSSEQYSTLLICLLLSDLLGMFYQFLLIFTKVDKMVFEGHQKYSPTVTQIFVLLIQLPPFQLWLLPVLTLAFTLLLFPLSFLLLQLVAEMKMESIIDITLQFLFLPIEIILL